MQTKKRSPFAAIVLAVVIGLLVIALLNGVIRPTQVVVAKVAICARHASDRSAGRTAHHSDGRQTGRCIDQS